MPEINNEADKQRVLETTLAKIEKDFGKGAVIKLGEKRSDNIPVHNTGALSVDIALGVGGVPKGRIIEIYGPESSGKTTLALHIVAEAQKKGGIAGYIDAEHALDPIYARNLGVKIDDLYISQPDDGEQALEIAEAMVRSCAIDIVVVDSVAALTPRSEIEGHMGESHMGLHARLMSQALRKLTAITGRTNCTVLFINQLRDKIGGMPGFGPQETTTGGRALKFYASVRIDIRKIETLKAGDSAVGNRTKVKIAKNKVAPPFKVCEFDIMYGQGISKEGDVLDLATQLDIVTKSGAWFSYKDLRLGQGRENAKNYLKENPAILSEIDMLVRKHYDLPDSASAPAESAAPAELPPESEKKAKSRKKAKSAAPAAESAEALAENAGTQSSESSENSESSDTEPPWGDDLPDEITFED
ncbi:MAG: recombinase RecA [Clostridiales bacterium]|nr:recombinase RecA [Clostridiales bacterium]